MVYSGLVSATRRDKPRDEVYGIAGVGARPEASYSGSPRPQAALGPGPGSGGGRVWHLPAALRGAVTRHPRAALSTFAAEGRRCFPSPAFLRQKRVTELQPPLLTGRGTLYTLGVVQAQGGYGCGATLCSPGGSWQGCLWPEPGFQCSSGHEEGGAVVELAS